MLAATQGSSSTKYHQLSERRIVRELMYENLSHIRDLLSAVFSCQELNRNE